jgi:hypothetical protein
LLGGEATITNVIVFDLTRPELEPTLTITPPMLLYYLVIMLCNTKKHKKILHWKILNPDYMPDYDGEYTNSILHKSRFILIHVFFVYSVIMMVSTPTLYYTKANLF